MYLEEKLDSLDKRLSLIEEKLDSIILKIDSNQSNVPEEVIKDNFKKFKNDWDSNAPNLDQLRGTLLTLRNALTGMTSSLSEEQEKIQEEKESTP